MTKKRREPRISGTSSTHERASGKVMTSTQRKAFNAREETDWKRRVQEEHAQVCQAYDHLEKREEDHVTGSSNDDVNSAWVDIANDSDDQAAPMEVNQVLDGTATIDISHEGGELFEMVYDSLNGGNRKPRVERRKRRAQVKFRNDAFKAQLEDMTNSYLSWFKSLGDRGLAEDHPLPSSWSVQDHYSIRVVDTYGASVQRIPLLEGISSIPASLIRNGIIPCAPHLPTVGFAIRVLELYRNLSLRSPHLTIQPFIKAISDIQGLPFRPYLCKQFSICFDVYLSIREEAERRVQAELKRDAPGWRLRHACPACTYKLVGEGKLVFKMLFTMDGNDSLKRVLRRSPEESSPANDKEEPVLGLPNEREEGREVSGDYYLLRAEVDKWAKEAIAEWLGVPGNLEALAAGDEYNPCEDRWKNMIAELTARMWGMFQETGIFLALCRHSFVLVVVDMVQSGELAKYPLAVVKALLDAFGPDLGGGYDIGCKFGITLARSPLGAPAKQLNYQSLVGSFHGHAHNRLCQLQFLATYVEGLGVEDLETCERFFSMSNALAKSIRHASRFHRQQKIVEFMKHMDRYKTYAKLSTFLVDNYKQSLSILSGKVAFLQQMHDQQISDTGVFAIWLNEEREYLQRLRREPLEETVKMEYWQALVNLGATERRRTAIFGESWNVLTAASIQTTADNTRLKETRRRHAQELERRDLLLVQELEKKLEVITRWIPNDEEWKETAGLVSKREYQRALDHLEGLIVSRMFELTKMNMSGTGYKLRKHIGNALKSHSQAVCTALERYNLAAANINPPRPELSWDNVVEYAFLADFDLLSDTWEDVRERPWSRPAARALMDQHFKMERAREEITRLNIEIPRFTTFIRDEEAFLLEKEQALFNTDPPLASQLRHRRLVFIRSNDVHVQRFQKLTALPGFTGSIAPGTSIHHIGVAVEEHARETPAENYGDDGEDDDGGGDNVEGDDDDEGRMHAVDAAWQALEDITSR